jgi:glyoxylase-like metal-dependent hydrolase (beta-lactamase superfamily II)
MKIQKFIFNLFQVNTYVIYDNDECIIIDPGNETSDEHQRLIDFIEQNKLKPKFILNTHCHIDHVVGVNKLKNYFNIDFYANNKDQYLIDNLEAVAKSYNINLSGIPTINRNISSKEKIKVGSSILDILEVPGHTPGHIAIFSQQEQFVLTGDVLFKDTIGRTDLPGGDLDQLMNSIVTQILPLGDEVLIYPGHGPNSKIGEERKNNPFL